MNRRAILIPAACLLASQLAAQCQLLFSPDAEPNRADGGVRAMVEWDPDGAGPQSPVAVVGGEFAHVGAQPLSRLAQYDPVSEVWSDFGGGVTVGAAVQALLPLASGELCVAGSFSEVGGVPAANIAVWNGSTWSAVGAGVPAEVNGLGVLPNGDLVVSHASGVMRWDGSSWSALPAPGLAPRGVLVRGNGDLLAFGVGANTVERWDGTGWSALGALTPFVGIGTYALGERPNGELVAAGLHLFGSLGSPGAVGSLGRWDGVSWQNVGSIGVAQSLAVTASGDVLVAGDTLARFDGSTLTTYPDTYTSAGTLALVELSGGEILGSLSTFSRVARLDGGGWTSIIRGTSGHVMCLAETGAGDLVVGGDITEVDGLVASGVAMRSNGVWSNLGGGVSGGPAVVTSVAAMPNGDIVAAGRFAAAGGVPCENIARWDGSTWSPLGAGLPSTAVNDMATFLAVLPNGDLVAAGDGVTPGGVATSRIGRWDGVTWSDMGPGTGLNVVRDMRVLDNGDLMVVGSLSGPPGTTMRVGRYDGSTWTLTQGPNYQPRVGTFLPNGDLVLGGQFTSVGGVAVDNIARWDGVSWSPMGAGLPGPVDRLLVLPNGDLLASGEYEDSLRRWDGMSWSTLGAGIDGKINLLMRRSGRVVMGGVFRLVDGQVTQSLAEIVPTCPAEVTPLGVGCSGSGGSVELQSDSLPWRGSVLHTTVTGLPANAIVAVAHGLSTTSQPLAGLLPMATAGCDLLVDPVFVECFVPSGMSLPIQFAVPNVPAMAGAEFYQQALPLVFDAQGLVEFTSSNALQLVIGEF